MEGALPSVVAGMVGVPVIAVPTSIGYGASFGGVAALLGMLNSCANGVSVVNIDNGYGAGCIASMINHLVEAGLWSRPERARLRTRPIYDNARHSNSRIRSHRRRGDGARADAAGRCGAGGARAVDRSAGSWSPRRRRPARRSRFLERHPAVSAARRRGACPRRSTRSRCRAGRSNRCSCACSPTSSIRSINRARASGRAGAEFPILRELVANVTAFKAEVEAVRQAIDPGGEVLDQASPELKRIRNELRQKRQKLRGTLEQFTRGGVRQVSAGRGRHRAQRPIRADGARRASRQRAGHRARLLHDRGDAVHGTGRDGRNQQRHRRARGSRARRDLPHPAGADGSLPRPAGRHGDQPRRGARARRGAGQGALQLESQRHRAGIHDRHQPAIDRRRATRCWSTRCRSTCCSIRRIACC